MHITAHLLRYRQRLIAPISLIFEYYLCLSVVHHQSYTPGTLLLCARNIVLFFSSQSLEEARITVFELGEFE